jgi:hypothetical protein
MFLGLPRISASLLTHLHGVLAHLGHGQRLILLQFGLIYRHVVLFTLLIKR